MRIFIVCLSLGVLFGETSLPVSAQQNQSLQQLTQEIELLKSKVSEREKQLQIVENVEKMELQAQLAEANTKLLNAEFVKFKRELKDSNDEWLRTWSYWFLGVIGFFALILLGVSAVFWSWLNSRANQLIADENLPD